MGTMGVRPRLAQIPNICFCDGHQIEGIPYVGFDVALLRRQKTRLKVFNDDGTHYTEPRFHAGDIELSYKVLTAQERATLRRE